MMLNPITAAVETVSRNIRLHGDHLAQNEYRTRAALIDPLLQALEWDTADPNQVQMEYPVKDGYADYALLIRNKPLMIIEAKKLRDDLPPHFGRGSVEFAGGDSQFIYPSVKSRVSLAGKQVNPRGRRYPLQQLVKLLGLDRMAAPPGGKAQFEFLNISPFRAAPDTVQNEFAIVIRQARQLDALRFFMPYQEPTVVKSPILNYGESPARVFLRCPQEQVAVRSGQIFYRQAGNLRDGHQPVNIGRGFQVFVRITETSIRPRRVNNDDRVSP